MLERKLIVDRYINLNNAFPAVPGVKDGSFVSVPVQDCYLQESTGFFKKTSGIQVGGGGGPKAHRNFKWLPWLPGRISEVNLVGSDVLTGPMSGCWLVTYRKPTGVPYAAHLGTDIADPQGTDDVNQFWNNFATSNPGQVIGGFNPLRHWQGAIPVKRDSEPAIPPKFFGLFTTTNEYYIMVGYQQAAPATMLRIAGLQQAPSHHRCTGCNTLTNLDRKHQA